MAATTVVRVAASSRPPGTVPDPVTGEQIPNITFFRIHAYRNTFGGLQCSLSFSAAKGESNEQSVGFLESHVAGISAALRFRAVYKSPYDWVRMTIHVDTHTVDVQYLNGQGVPYGPPVPYLLDEDFDIAIN